MQILYPVNNSIRLIFDTFEMVSRAKNLEHVNFVFCDYSIRDRTRIL